MIKFLKQCEWYDWGCLILFPLNIILQLFEWNFSGAIGWLMALLFLILAIRWRFLIFEILQEYRNALNGWQADQDVYEKTLDILEAEAKVGDSQLNPTRH